MSSATHKRVTISPMKNSISIKKDADSEMMDYITDKAKDVMNN
jgi:hypothetical protein